MKSLAVLQHAGGNSRISLVKINYLIGERFEYQLCKVKCNYMELLLLLYCMGKRVRADIVVLH